MGEPSYLDVKKFSKYYGEQSPWHDGALLWPGYAGLPALSEFVKEKNTQFYTIYSFFHSKKFNLEDSADLEYYQWVRDRIANGWFIGSRLELKWGDNGLEAYMEWTQRYVIPISLGDVSFETTANNQQ